MSIVKSSLNFGSGRDNVEGLQLKLTFDEDTRTVYGEYRCPERFQGEEEGKVHSGILSSILDEVMRHISIAMNFDAFTSELTIRYLQSANIREQLYLRGWFVKKNRRTIESRAEIENEIGKIVARAKGKYTEKEEE